VQRQWLKPALKSRPQQMRLQLQTQVGVGPAVGGFLTMLNLFAPEGVRT
jgi:hypothetical protein